VNMGANQYCTNCGEAIDSYAHFCPNCGHAMSA
jgi:predicted RNA-binding Zn-ribbon protein involved in translation (DUF1610 family)